MLRCVFDTNVLVSAGYFGVVPRKVLSEWEAGRIELLVSDEILAEYGEVVRRRDGDPNAARAIELCTLVVTHARRVAPVRLSEQVCRDADDDMFIACALGATRAGLGRPVIISGDRGLLAASGDRGGAASGGFGAGEGRVNRGAGGRVAGGTTFPRGLGNIVARRTCRRCGVGVARGVAATCSGHIIPR